MWIGEEVNRQDNKTVMMISIRSRQRKLQQYLRYEGTNRRQPQQGDETSRIKLLWGVANQLWLVEG